MSSLLLASAIFDVGFGIFHLAFWRLFAWPQTLAASGGINRAITQTLNAMLSYCFFAYALALLWHGQGAPAGALAWAGAGFWLLRAVLQPIMFSARHRLSLGLTVVFVAGAALHGALGLAD